VAFLVAEPEVEEREVPACGEADEQRTGLCRAEERGGGIEAVEVPAGQVGADRLACLVGGQVLQGAACCLRCESRSVDAQAASRQRP
jgi:hypothetical protein